MEQIVDISPGVALGRGLRHLLVLQMRILLGFFELFFTKFFKKSAKLASHSSLRVPASGSPSTPAAQLHALEKKKEEEEEERRLTVALEKES